MSKTITFRGTLDMGTEDELNLKTNQGKVGYKITKLQAISTKPGTVDHDEVLIQVFRKSQVGSIGNEVHFTDSDLLAVCMYEDNDLPAYMASNLIIFDNSTFNQNIFISATDTGSGTKPVNYYIELEQMALSDIEATMLTLQSMRQIASP